MPSGRRKEFKIRGRKPERDNEPARRIINLFWPSIVRVQVLFRVDCARFLTSWRTIEQCLQAARLVRGVAGDKGVATHLAMVRVDPYLCTEF